MRLNTIFKNKIDGDKTHSLCVFMNQTNFFETYEWAEYIYDTELRGNKHQLQKENHDNSPCTNGFLGSIYLYKQLHECNSLL